MAAGYSGTPLAKKLGIKPGHTIATINEPDDFRELLVDLPADASFRTDLAGDPDISIGFFTTRHDLEDHPDTRLSPTRKTSNSATATAK